MKSGSATAYPILTPDKRAPKESSPNRTILFDNWSVSAGHDSLRLEHRAAVQHYLAAIRDLAALVDTSATDSEFDLAHLRIRAASGACQVAEAALKLHPAKHGLLARR